MTRHEKLLQDGEFIKLACSDKFTAEIHRLYPEHSYDTIRRARDAAKKINLDDSAIQGGEEEVVQDTIGDNGNVRHLQVKNGSYTLEELIKWHNINTDIWNVSNVEYGKWDSVAKLKDSTGNEFVQVTPLSRISAKFVRNKRVELALQSLKQVLEDIKDYSPKVKRKKYKNELKENIQEISIFDLHVGKLAWREESGDDYDSDIACDLFMKAIDYHVKYGRLYQPERYLLPIGNDFFNIDNGRNMTTAGTPQDVDTRWMRMFRMGREVLVDAIEHLTQFAPVDVVIVSGNHDTETAWHLGESLHCWFHNNENVTVDNSPKLRKLYTYGENSIGFTHGNREKVKDLPLIFATEFRERWGKSKWREIHHGHFHSKRSLVSMPVDEQYGVRIRQLPSLSGNDAWHYSKGYNGVRAAESFIWNKKDGMVANLSFNP